MTVAVDLDAAILAAITGVDDPEYPGVSIVDLGLLERVDVESSGHVRVGLIPTFSGCPALKIIAADVEKAVQSVDQVDHVQVEWLHAPVWTPERLTEHGQHQLASSFTVAVQIGRQDPTCPLCGAPTQEQSMFGPSRCRSVHRCTSCAEPVEVMRA